MSAGLEWTPCQIIALRKRGERYLELSLSPKTTYAFEAGQYIELLIPGQSPQVRLTLSIASAPRTDRTFDLCILTDSYDLRDLLLKEYQKCNDLLVKKPAGSFGGYLTDAGRKALQSAQQIVLLAGGSGIAPLRSLLQLWLQDQSVTKSISIIYGCQSGNAIPYFEELTELARSCPTLKVSFVSKLPGVPSVRLGQVIDYLPDLLPLKPRAKYFICGPLGMVSACREWLQQEGVGLDDIYFER